MEAKTGARGKAGLGPPAGRGAEREAEQTFSVCVLGISTNLRLTACVRWQKGASQGPTKASWHGLATSIPFDPLSHQRQGGHIQAAVGRDLWPERAPALCLGIAGKPSLCPGPLQNMEFHAGDPSLRPFHVK